MPFINIGLNKMEEKNWKMIDCMEIYGGSFVKALANCLRKADSHNYSMLKFAFPRYIREYEVMAGRVKKPTKK